MCEEGRARSRCGAEAELRGATACVRITSDADPPQARLSSSPSPRERPSSRSVPLLSSVHAPSAALAFSPGSDVLRLHTSFNATLPPRWARLLLGLFGIESENFAG